MTNDQRNVIYTLRNNLLNAETNMIETIIPMIEHAVDAVAQRYLIEGMLPEEWDYASLTEEIEALLSNEEIPSLSANNVHSIEDLHILLKDSISNYVERVKALENNTGAQQALRQLGLHFLDSNWTNHLSAMQHLKEGIGLRQYQQEDPIRLYQKKLLKFSYKHIVISRKKWFYILHDT